MRTKYFDIQPIVSVDLQTESIEGKRYYVTPNGKYPSVTTILGAMSADGIKAWIEKVGKEEAARISNTASTRGVAVHTIAENYLLNKEDYTEGHTPANIETFNQIKVYLDDHCDQVYGNEIALYSDDLRTAGRCDLVGRIHGIRTIGDFKTSKKWKKEEWIESYFLQCTTYALMLHERHGVWCPQICVMMATDADGLQPVLKQTSKYVEKVRHFFDNWHANNAKK